MSERLGESFFNRSVHEVAAELVGCELLVDGVGGVIVETEAYDEDEPACHGYNGLTPTRRNLFGPPGRAYVYISYGLHRMLNMVCERDGRAAAVLIRALEPSHGIEAMRERRGLERLTDLCSGPGKLAEALAIGTELDGRSLAEDPFELRRPARGREPEVVSGPRIGITRAIELPWRFCAAGNRFVSRPRPPVPAA